MQTRFDNSRALLAVDFIQSLCHGDDFWGQPFDLLPWQHRAVSEFYGTLQPDKDARQYQYLYLEIPKKNGKSELAAALGLYHTFADSPYPGLVHIYAADRENASIIYTAAISMIEQCPELQAVSIVRKSTREIRSKVNGTIMKVMSAEDGSKHGYKPTCVIIDELHAQPNRRLWDTVTFGAGSARKEPVWIVLTTAGNDPDRASIGWEIHKKAQDIIDYRAGKGGQDNPVWLPYIFAAPEGADIWDEAVWYAANPSLGYTLDINTVRQEALDARNFPTVERLFRWLRLNQWVTLKASGWLPLTLFDETLGAWSPADLLGKRCYQGLDLGSTNDLTARVLVFPPQEGVPDWRVLFRAYIPEDRMREREVCDGVPFSEWVRDKHVIATPGDAVDYEFIEAQLLEDCRLYDVRLLGTDQWNSRMLTQRLSKTNEYGKQGLDAYGRCKMIAEIAQSIAGMSPAMKEMERLLRTRQMTHEKSPAARWCFGNVRVATDGNENYKPMKNKSIDRIDITVAWINAITAAMMCENLQGSAYETRGLHVL